MNKSNPFSNFGSLVFNEHLMKERLPHPSYIAWKKTVSKESKLDRNTADDIAHAMKRWALENNCTHFTHWFQPMTGSTAEKHESFIEPDRDNMPLVRFSGKSLIKGEPDASSFPSGGLRATFEARGYTYWDCTSPAFIRDNVLCIPTVFISYTGESLDKKSPLLKSCDAVDSAATKIVNIFGDKDVKHVSPMVGLEQEYFLIDRGFYEKRLDLKLCQRTLFGALPPKAQEMDDHYFGSIPTRVAAFMKEVNEELWKLGIYAKAEHNEVAPCQFELAPVFSHVNIAVDQNQLTMDILKKTAEKHGFACLLHEKPFKGINGSGKHNNYSLVSDDKQNLFEPGDKPSENVRFLLFVCAFIKAVDTYPELLRIVASGAGNDHRLGASEAPPAIISIYMGDVIENILLNLEDGAYQGNKNENDNNFNSIGGLSYVPKDNTDRNRTSPMAFTGNKFEFRMVGSSLSSASANIALNTMLADVLNDIALELEDLKYKQDIREKALKICKRIIKDHKRILFSKDGYSDDWKDEAQQRGLVNIPSYIEAVGYYTSDKIIKLYSKNNVFNEKELEARKDILIEQYNNTINIETKTMNTMIHKEIIPNIIKHLNLLYKVPSSVISTSYFTEIIERLTTTIEDLNKLSFSCSELITELNQLDDKLNCGLRIRKEVVPLLDAMRTIIDDYENIAPKECYNIPTYSDMLFK